MLVGYHDAILSLVPRGFVYGLSTVWLAVFDLVAMFFNSGRVRGQNPTLLTGVYSQMRVYVVSLFVAYSSS